jgi:hypothetical protein
MIRSSPALPAGGSPPGDISAVLTNGRWLGGSAGKSNEPPVRLPLPSRAKGSARPESEERYSTEGKDDCSTARLRHWLVQHESREQDCDDNV